MESIVAGIILASIPSIVAAVTAYRINHKADERYNEQKEQHDERVTAEQLQMEMQLATAELAYATAIAIKRGKANGEVEAGIDSYERAKTNYIKFVNEKYIKDITK